MNSQTVSVCLCTFRRPGVRQTLEGLAAQRLPEGWHLDVVVVDSDTGGSARALIAAAAAELAVPIAYHVADRAGVTAARNLAVQCAAGEWLWFIDDDEVPEAACVARLLDCAQEHHAAVVFGAVRTLYPENSPAWIRSADLFGKPLAPTGTRVSHGATCNALVRRSVLTTLPHCFDERFGTTGGEDTELFDRLSRQGVVMVACREAAVAETVELKRLNRHYLLRKAVRVGETYFRIIGGRSGPLAAAWLLGKAGLQCVVAAGMAVLLRPLGMGRSMRFQIKAAANLGKLRAAAGWPPVELYKG